MAHTPGPWKIEAIAIMGKCFTGEWRAICDVVRGGTPKEKYANAQLISAAPDLLKALENIVEFCEHPRARETSEALAMGLGLFLPAARAAIRKAKGEA